MFRALGNQKLFPTGGPSLRLAKKIKKGNQGNFGMKLCSSFTMAFEILAQIVLKAFLRTTILKASEALHIGCIT